MSVGLCKRGHELTMDNVYVAPKTGIRSCRECQRLRLAKSRSKDAPGYRAGLQVSHRDNHRFGGMRELAIQRDGEKCVRCGMTRAEHRERFGRDITVDHIDGHGRYTPRELNNNDLSNLETLCAPCHGHKDGSRGWGKKPRLTAADVRDIRMYARAGLGYMTVARCYQMVHPTTVQKIMIGKTWKWVEPSKGDTDS